MSSIAGSKGCVKKKKKVKIKVNETSIKDNKK